MRLPLSATIFFTKMKAMIYHFFLKLSKGIKVTRYSKRSARRKFFIRKKNKKLWFYMKINDRQALSHREHAMFVQQNKFKIDTVGHFVWRNIKLRAFRWWYSMSKQSTVMKMHLCDSVVQQPKQVPLFFLEIIL